MVLIPMELSAVKYDQHHKNDIDKAREKPNQRRIRFRVIRGSPEPGRQRFRDPTTDNEDQYGGDDPQTPIEQQRARALGIQPGRE